MFRLRTVAIVFVISVAAAFAQQIPMNPKLYDPSVDARKEISETLRESAKDHKRIILVFGGNWCFDCHVLDYRFHEAGMRELVDNNFHVVHVDIGRGEKNGDILKKYNATIDKGVPTLVVLEADGKLLYSDRSGEFESARSMDPQQIKAFLEKWKK